MLGISERQPMKSLQKNGSQQFKPQGGHGASTPMGESSMKMKLFLSLTVVPVINGRQCLQHGRPTLVPVCHFGPCRTTSDQELRPSTLSWAVGQGR